MECFFIKINIIKRIELFYVIKYNDIKRRVKEKTENMESGRIKGGRMNNYKEEEVGKLVMEKSSISTTLKSYIFTVIITFIVAFGIYGVFTNVFSWPVEDGLKATQFVIEAEKDQ